MGKMAGRFMLRRVYITVFAVSGFSGLIYESIWTHYLKLFLGHAAYAQTLVLIIFMGGMALGAAAASRWGGRVSNLLLGYALVELLVGLAGVFYHLIFTSFTEFAYRTVMPNMASGLPVTLLKWGIGIFLILPQSVLLGMTFPLMSAGVLRRFPSTPGRSLALLYCVNSLGAALGVLASGFLLIDLVGLPGTILTAGLVNIALALLVWLLCSRDRERSVSVPSTGATARMSGRFGGFLCCAAITGAASFMYEIGWIRMLSLVLSSTTHAFELMLSAFIFGLALGGYWIKRRIDGLRNPVAVLGIIQLIMGSLALTTLLSYGQTFELMSFAVNALAKTEQGYGFFNVFSHSLALLVMLPVTTCAGMTLPLLTYHLVAKGHGEGSIGAIYAANTVGSIIGVLLAVHLVMPALGVKNVIVIGAGLDIALGLVLLWFGLAIGDRIRWVAVASLALGGWLASVFLVELDTLKMASGVYHTGVVAKDAENIFHRDGKTASIDLLRVKNGLVLSTNGKPDASVGNVRTFQDEHTMVLLAALPVAVHGRPRTAAVIGLGSGMTTHTLLTAPFMDRVDTIEIEPAVLEAARGFGSRVARSFNDPRSHLYIEDAKAFFSNRHQRYDLIVSEPSNPWVSGVAGLFSSEFYRKVGEYIDEGGLFVQWVQQYSIDIPSVASIVKAISDNFDDYAVYFPVEGDIIVIAKPEGSVSEPDFKVLFSSPELADAMSRIGINGQQDLLLRKLGTKRSLEALFRSYAIPSNSDYFPVLESRAARSRYLGEDALELQRLRVLPLQLIDVIEERPIRTEALDVTENNHVLNTMRAWEAGTIYAYFKAVADGASTEVPLADGIGAEVRSLRSIHSLCGPASLERGWLVSLQKVMRRLLPYLSPVELEVVWRDIEAADCFRTLSPRVKVWASLYRAVGSRNLALAQDCALQLLPAWEIKASEENNFLLAVAMLAQLQSGNPAAVMELWGRYEARQQPPVELRLLAARVLTSVGKI